MPRQIVSLGKGSPGNDPDSGIRNLITALAASQNASANASTASLNDRKFKKILTDEDAKFKALSKLIPALPKQSSEKTALEQGQGTEFFDTLRQITNPSTRVKSPNRDEDPEVTNRKQAISTTVPKAIPDEFSDSDFNAEERKRLGITKPLTPEEVAEAKAFADQLDREQAKDKQQFNESRIEESDIPGSSSGAGVRPGPFKTSGPAVTSNQNDLSVEDISFKERNPDLDLGVSKGLPVVIDKKSGAEFPRGLSLPEERRTPILNALENISPRGVNELLKDKTFGPVIQAALNDKPLSAQIFEKLVENAASKGDHGKVMKDGNGNFLLMDLSGEVPRAVKINSNIGAVVSGLKKSEVGDKYWNFLLTKGGLTLAEIQSGVDKNGNRIDGKSLGKGFNKWMIDKDFTRTQMALENSKLYLKSSELKRANNILSSTKNIFNVAFSPTMAKTVGDQALVTMFNKLTDPESVVREGEFERIFKARNLPGTVLAFVRKMKNFASGGALLNDAEVSAIKEFALRAMVSELADGGLSDIIEIVDNNMNALGLNVNQAIPPSMRDRISEANEIQLRLKHTGNDIIKAARITRERRKKLKKRRK